MGLNVKADVSALMNLRLPALVVTCLVVSAPVTAEVEKVAFQCGQEFCFRWWPKVVPADGGQHDRDHSLDDNFNALSPRGSTFSVAETVVYANAIYKLRVPEDKTLASFIHGDLERFKRWFLPSVRAPSQVFALPGAHRSP